MKKVAAGLQGDSRIYLSRSALVGNGFNCVSDSGFRGTTGSCRGATKGRTCGMAAPALGMSLMNGGCAILKLPGPRSFSSAAMLGPCVLSDVTWSMYCMV